MIYQKTKNIRAIQLLLGHTKIENIIKYLGVELEDALRLSEEIES
ncbi:Integrase (fragment) [Vibrio coralliirubri]